MEEENKAINSRDSTRKALISMLEDIKEQRDELERAYKELKETTVNLVQNEKMIALGELTAGVAHELNQPLNGIKIISQDIARDITKDRFDQKHLLEDIKDIINQVNKMSSIIDHMRIFTRRTTGLPKEKVDINMPIESFFKFLGQQLKVHNIEVIKELGTGLHVTGDPIKLEQVFMNLITNARDAVEGFEKEKEMKITIRSTMRNKKSGNPEVMVEVEDNGPGIPEHLREKIFEPFFTTKKPAEGTGLGLSVTRQIIKEHGGRIEVDSKEGEWTIFRIFLPATPLKPEMEVKDGK